MMMPGHWKRSARLNSSGTIWKQSVDRRRRHDEARVVALARTQHLPQVALLGLGRDAGGRAGALHVDADDRHLHHGRGAERLGHQREAAARGRAHRPRPGVRRADGHVDHAQLVLDLADHDAELRAVAAIQCSTPVDGLIGYAQ